MAKAFGVLCEHHMHWSGLDIQIADQQVGVEAEEVREGGVNQERSERQAVKKGLGFKKAVKGSDPCSISYYSHVRPKSQRSLVV